MIAISLNSDLMLICFVFSVSFHVPIECVISFIKHMGVTYKVHAFNCTFIALFLTFRILIMSSPYFGLCIFLLHCLLLISNQCFIFPSCFSDGKELYSLILSDLYYHLQGELEGRKIDHRLFNELSQHLVESKFLHTYLHKYDGDLSAQAKDVYLFDLVRLRADLGLELWYFSEWRESKAVAETMLLYLQDVNSMVLLAKSKLSALNALITTLSVYNEDVSSQNSDYNLYCL